jgi:mRNA-degrading endonuclease RelE of RelBE toxin-antitoxin system
MKAKDFSSLVRSGLAEVERGAINYWAGAAAPMFLRIVLDAEQYEELPLSHEELCPAKVSYTLAAKSPRLSEPAPKRPPPWYIGWSSAFSKSIVKIDPNIQGRILEALNEITKDPVTVRGDTMKPLTGEFRGCWRYRIGAFRLVYKPDRASGDVTLLAFASRGSVYED